MKDKTKKSPFPKLALLCDCRSHFILNVWTGKGPGSDHGQLKPLLEKVAGEALLIDVLLADAGYDSEEHHVYCREKHDIESIIPPTIGRPTKKPPTGKNRRRMKEHWDAFRPVYGQRWQVETVNSMYKRMLGSALRARKYWSRCREMALRALTLNIMIIAAVG